MVKNKVSMVTARLRTARLQQTNHNTIEVLEKWLHTIGYLKRMYHRFRLLRRCGMSTEASWSVGGTVTPFSPWWQPKRTLSRKPTTLLLKQKSFITIQMPLNMQSHHQMSNSRFIIFSITSHSVILPYPRHAHSIYCNTLVLERCKNRNHSHKRLDAISSLPKSAIPTKNGH